MTTRVVSVLRRALALMSFRLVLEQIALATVLSMLFALWLRVPDGSAPDVIGSALLAVVILLVAGAGESRLMLGLCGSSRSGQSLFRGALILIVAAALWFGWDELLTRLQAHDALRAGYLNSRFPHDLRNLFSYEHILRSFVWLAVSLRWIGAGIITMICFGAVTRQRMIDSVRRGLRSSAFWLALLLAGVLSVSCTSFLLHWTPGHGLRVEVLSLVVRLVLVLVVDAVLAVFLLTILAGCMCETNATYVAPAGIPVDSQPRRASKP